MKLASLRNVGFLAPLMAFPIGAKSPVFLFNDSSQKVLKKAFKGFKGKIIIKKKAMSKTQFNKLKAKLKKGGFKGKISYKK